MSGRASRNKGARGELVGPDALERTLDLQTSMKGTNV